MADKLVWDNFPDMVQVNIFKFLDRKSLNNLRQISAAARQLIEHFYGIDAIVPCSQETNWLGCHYTYLVSEEVMCHMLRQMKGKRVRTLEIQGMPSLMTLYPFTHFLQYPKCLQHAKLKFIDITLLHFILSQCCNLRSLEYTTDFRNPPRTIAIFPSSVTNTNLVSKLNEFPDRPNHLNYLKQLTMTMNAFCFTNGSDWGNVMYLLISLPVLPLLTTLELQVKSNGWIQRNTHMLFLACLGDFLLKTPNLQTLKYNSSLKFARDVAFNRISYQIMRAIIRQRGTELLKEASRTESAIDRNWLSIVQPFYVAAARNLTSLRKLHLKIANDMENSLYVTLLSNLPGSLTTCYIVDTTAVTVQDTPTTEAEKNKVYKFFTVQHNDDNGQRRIMTLPVHQHITELHLRCNFLPSTTLSLNKILERLPHLKNLDIQKIPAELTRAYGHFEENPLHNPFVKLETLTLSNFNVGDFSSPAPSITALILQCQNLQKLEVKFFHTTTRPWYDPVNRGIHVTDLLQILSSLRKLDKIILDKVYFTLSTVDSTIDTLEQVDQSRKNMLERIGCTFIDCRKPWRIMLVGGVIRNINDFDFACQ